MLFAPSQKSAISSAASLLILAQTISPVAAGCNSYVTTGSTGNQTYNNYALYDFRHLPDDVSGTPVYAQDENFPNGQFALATSPFFNSTTWTNYWSSIADLKKADPNLSQYVDTVFTPLNVAIGKIVWVWGWNDANVLPAKDNSTTPDGETVLSLTTTRLEGYSPSAQIQSNQKFMHASVRMSARMLGPPGACGSFFLYGDDNNESDIELLTNDTQNGASMFHATNHPSQDSKGNTIPGASTIAPIPLNGTQNGTQTAPWSEWTNWRMDWLSDRTQWIVNGDLVVDKTWSPPKIPSYLSVNMWVCIWNE